MIVDFVPEVTEENALIFDIKSKPKNLKNFWAVVTKIDRHPFISQAIAIYVNQDFPSGTIIVSKYFYHKYPDFYVVYDKENNAMRVYTSPPYRGNKNWEYFALLFKNFFYLNLGEHTNLSQDRSVIGEEMYLKIKKSVLEKGEDLESFFNPATNIRNDFSEKDVPRDPCFPYIWYNHRMGETNE
jgi:hypothetical protein